jgi:hypothetical protein
MIHSRLRNFVCGTVPALVPQAQPQSSQTQSIWLAPMNDSVLKGRWDREPFQLSRLC